jgi:hypothetical protein
MGDSARQQAQGLQSLAPELGLLQPKSMAIQGIVMALDPGSGRGSTCGSLTHGQTDGPV